MANVAEVAQLQAVIEYGVEQGATIHLQRGVYGKRKAVLVNAYAFHGAKGGVQGRGLKGARQLKRVAAARLAKGIGIARKQQLAVAQKQHLVSHLLDLVQLLRA